jgi:hypothetical protein
VRKIRAKRSEYDASVKKWQQAIKCWDVLFYCQRCDRVFVPGKEASAPVQQMSHFLTS